MLLQSSEIHCFTSMYISDGFKENTTLYRADPYFYKKPWMDWCNYSWDINGVKMQFPCRMLMFIDTKDMFFYSSHLAIIKSTIDNSNPSSTTFNNTCKLVKSFEVEKEIRITDSCKSLDS